MIERPPGFLSEKHIDHDSEVFSYISELHNYLWKFVEIANPGASGHLNDHVDDALRRLQPIGQFAVSLTSGDRGGK